MDFDFIDFPEEINLVEQLVNTTRHTDGALAREVANYIGLGGGKKIRPRILILTARQLGYDTPPSQMKTDDPVIQAAAAIEIVHTASLIHDDIVDHSNKRRGRPSVHQRFGHDVAILIADLLYARAFDLALLSVGTTAARRLCQVTRSMCESELFQIEKREAILSESEYYSIIDRKTAGLFSLCTEIGARLTQADQSTTQHAAELGRAFGMAYQITDDVLDYTATDNAWGKPLGGDLAEGKQTLPLVATWQKAQPEDRRQIETLMGNGHDIEKVLKIIKRYDGINYAQSRARQFKNEAVEIAKKMTNQKHAEQFEQVTNAILQRTF